MRNCFIIFVLLFLFVGCSATEDCVKSSGEIILKEFSVAEFDKIIVYNGISLVITQGENYKVEVKTGSNLIDGITINVNNEMLVLKDNSTCNWVRDYGQTTVYVTTPKLSEIYSKTEKNITSNGELKFPSLKLVAMDEYDHYKGTGTGDFILDIDNENLVLETNNISQIIISGKTKNFYIGVYDGNGIVNAQNLLAKEIIFYHRGTNKLLVNPINALKGEIYSYGNVISFTKPAVVEVIEHYKGKLIYH